MICIYIYNIQLYTYNVDGQNLRFADCFNYLCSLRNIAAGHLVRSDHQWNRHGWQKSLWHLQPLSCNCELRVVWLDQNKIQLLMTQIWLSHVITWLSHRWLSHVITWLSHRWLSHVITVMWRCGSMWVDVEHAKTMTQASLQAVAWPV